MKGISPKIVMMLKQPNNAMVRGAGHVVNLEAGQHSGTEVPSTRDEIREAGRATSSLHGGEPHTQGMYTGLHLGLAGYGRAF